MDDYKKERSSEIFVEFIFLDSLKNLKQGGNASMSQRGCMDAPACMFIFILFPFYVVFGEL